MLTAVIPVKEFSDAKQRLAEVLSPAEREQLSRAMLEDVLTALKQHSEISQIIVLSDDESARRIADDYCADWWPESSVFDNTDVALEQQGEEPGGCCAEDTNNARLRDLVDAAAEKLRLNGVETILVVHGDMPLLSVDDIDQLICKHNIQTRPALTVAPDKSQQGSNCTLVSPPNAVPFQFGSDSYFKHLDIATRRGVTGCSSKGATTGLDIDTVEDLKDFLSKKARASRAYQFLQGIRVDKRLPVFPNNQCDENASVSEFVSQVLAGTSLTDQQARLLAAPELSSEQNLKHLCTAASLLRDKGFRNVVTYSRKVFLPLTQLCRDVCHYCTFAKTPKKISSAFMPVNAVLETVKKAADQGCKEALFTLGEKPEARYQVARDDLQEMGFESTIEYVAEVAKRVVEETGVLPHINAGCMTEAEIALLRPVSASMGLMLESVSSRLCEKGMPHYGSPDKQPERRLQTLEYAGKAAVPTTSGILIGIGETRLERIDSLLALRAVHLKYGHIQEIIVQNFRAKPETKMAQAPEPDLNELLWTIAVARLVFGPDMSIQAPPNLSPGVLPKIIDAGINDWGGVSPVTPDFVNPEAPWPHLRKLSDETRVAGKFLHERLTIYPSYAINEKKWLDKRLRAHLLRMIDTEGFPRVDNWSPGSTEAVPNAVTELLSNKSLQQVSPDVKYIVKAARRGTELSEHDIVRLFQARGDDLSYVCQQADALRQRDNGRVVTYAVNRNINYTNVCLYKCEFCAFAKGKRAENLRGKPYDLDLAEIQRRSREAWRRGATEVCMQGGIHPRYTGDTYLNILKAIKEATPGMHVHAFSPLEVMHGAETLGLSVTNFLGKLREAGLGTLPGTAAEILDDEVRADLCPDKISTDQWLDVMQSAHKLGIRTTATIMFGHIERIEHCARHLLRIRGLQMDTGGFTEFVPLPFVHMESPVYLRGKSRKGPTFREALLMHAVARLTLAPAITNIQASWVKLGEQGVNACISAGANDLGGTLMNETITRSAGAEHGQEYSPETMVRLIQNAGRLPSQRNTLYGNVPDERVLAAAKASELLPVVNARPQAQFSQQKVAGVAKQDEAVCQFQHSA